MVETGLCFLLASVVGSIVYIVLVGIQCAFNRNEYIKLRHALWHGGIIIYLTLLLGGWILNLLILASPGCYLWGAGSPTVRSLLKTISILWLVGAVIQLAYYSYFRFMHRRAILAASNCENRVLAIAEKLGYQMNIRKKIQVVQGYGLVTPELVGLFKPVIYLPGDTTYTDEQLQAIIMHELFHYKHGDKLFREIAVIVHCINWFNPIMPMINKQMELWDEVYCDLEVLNFGIMDRTSYGNVLFELANRMIGWEKEEFLFAVSMCKKQFYLKDRVVKLMEYTGEVKQKMGLFWILLLSMIITGSSTALAAGEGAAQLLDVANEITIKEYQEEMVVASGELQEYIIDVDDSVVNELSNDELQPLAESSGLIRVSLTNSQWKSGYFNASAGEAINVHVIANPNTVNIKVGIYDPSGVFRYVYSSGTITHTFELSQSGAYYVFVKNETNTTVSINGSYLTLTEQ